MSEVQKWSKQLWKSWPWNTVRVNFADNAVFIFGWSDSMKYAFWDFLLYQVTGAQVLDTNRAVFSWKCYFLQINTKVCSKVPIFYFDRPKRSPDNCYVTCLLQENTCLVWVPIATIQILTGLYYWCYQGNSKSPITCSIAQSCGRFSLWYHFPLNKNLW